jgi:hypothetical protein
VSIKADEATSPSQKKYSGLNIKPTSLVYWLRFLLALIAGVSSSALRISSTQPVWGGTAQYVGIGIGACFYAVSILIVRYIFKFGEVELKGKHKDITLGGGTFIVVWVMVLVLANSLVNSLVNV